MHVKMNDKVKLLAGKDKGLTGEIIAIDHARGRVKVARRNMIVKHKRPNPLTGEAGNRVEQEGWLDASNVALFHDEHGVERTWNRYVGANGEFFANKAAARASFGDAAPAVIQKVRVGKKSGHAYDAYDGASVEE